MKNDYTRRRFIGENTYTVTEVEIAKSIMHHPSTYMHRIKGVTRPIDGSLASLSYIAEALRNREHTIHWKSALVRRLISRINSMLKQSVTDKGIFERTVKELETQLEEQQGQIQRLRKSTASRVSPPPEAGMYERATKANLAVLQLHTQKKFGRKTACRHCMMLSDDAKKFEYPCATRRAIEEAMR